MNRRGFLEGILAACAAPAIIRIESLMPVRKIVVPTLGEIVAVSGNHLFSIEMFTAKALSMLEKNWVFAESGKSDTDFAKRQMSIGNTVRVKIPNIGMQRG